MKTLRFLFSGIFCILISYSLCSCGGGDDEDVTFTDSGQSGNNGPNQPGTNTSKKLVSVDIDYSGDHETVKFQYDNQGNLSSVSIEEEDEISKFSFTYEDDRILMTGIEEEHLDGSGHGELKNMTYYLSNGKVTSIRDEETELDDWGGQQDYEHSYYNLEYDNSQNRLIRVSGNSSFSSGDSYNNYSSAINFSFSWIGDEIKSINHESYYESYIYKRSITCKGFFPILLCLDAAWELDECYLLMVNPELASIKTNTLPDASVNADESRITYTYELDNEGYLRKMCKQYSGGTSTYYIFTWK